MRAIAYRPRAESAVSGRGAPGRRAPPHVPVRQWVLSLPIPLRLLLAAQPKRVTPVVQVVHCVLTRLRLGQVERKADDASSGAVTLIQRFGSAASLNIHLTGSTLRAGVETPCRS